MHLDNGSFLSLRFCIILFQKISKNELDSLRAAALLNSTDRASGEKHVWGELMEFQAVLVASIVLTFFAPAPPFQLLCLADLESDLINPFSLSKKLNSYVVRAACVSCAAPAQVLKQITNYLCQTDFPFAVG